MHSADYEQLSQQVRHFVFHRAPELARDIEDLGTCGPEIWQELRQEGFLRLAAPQEYGGIGLDFIQYLQLLELFSQMHGSLRMIVHVNNGIWRALARRATKEQVERFVRAQVAGDIVVAFTLTEPNAGTGTDIQTTCYKDGNTYYVSGEKWLITFGDTADWYLLFARLAKSQGDHGTIALMVPRNTPRLIVEPMPPAMGLRGTGHAHLILNDCPVDVSCRLGEEGEGLDIAFQGFLEPSRIGIAMTCVGLAQRAWDLAVARAHERVTFGKPLISRPVIREWLADMATDITAARQLTLYAAKKWQTHHHAPAESSMAKLFGSQMLQRVTDLALQIHGGGGYFQGSEIERIYRDARAQRFEEGTAEIQKVTIAKALLSSPLPATENAKP
ncbi:acyl-CoA dehydrogenase family protein [Sulfobacillus thermosulfidooxidans]|uniref:acyl-CoA dehydrogenase family protein n=1 Tax=Sulfobacillus thermosulfidooxidans TaxID=28034 RepID=UPI0006B5390A|nr:acyl-CoA dehydrogenase family protein [Sulfobacillus thermosulfidooxidans]